MSKLPNSKKPKTKELWDATKVGYRPRDQPQFLYLIYFFRKAPSFLIQDHLGQIVTDSDIIVLQNSTHKTKVLDRPRFESNPIPALLNWMLREDSKWDRFLVSSSKEAELARGILHLVDFHLKTHKYTVEEVCALTLVARRLIWLASSGFNIFKRRSLIDAMKSYGKWYLPKAGVMGPLEEWISKDKYKDKNKNKNKKNPFQPVVRSTVNRFLMQSALFLQGKQINGSSRNDYEAEIAKDRGLKFYLNDGSELMGISVEPTHQNADPIATLHQAHAAATSMLAPDPRALIATRTLLKREHFNPAFYDSRMKLRIVRVTAGMVSALIGVPIQEILDISLLPPKNISAAFEYANNSGISGKQRVIGYICSRSEWQHQPPANGMFASDQFFSVYCLVGPSRHSGMSSRIQNQFIEIPLPGELAPMIHACRSVAAPEAKDVQTFSVLLRDDALEKIRSGLVQTFTKEDSNDWRDRYSRYFIKSPEGAFKYLALTECGVPPAILSLVIGKPIGVWRAALNYSCVSKGQIFEAVQGVQKKLLLLSGFNNPTWDSFPPVGRSGAGLLKNGKIAEPGVPALRELVEHQKNETTISSTSSWASLDFLIRLFGGRFSKMLWNPTKNYLGSAGYFAVTDKNLRGKIFPRLIPLIEILESKLINEPWSKLPYVCEKSAKNDALIEKIRNPTGDPNAGRKSLYSHLLADSIGDEAVSAIFGHGLALTKLFGPITPIPTTWFLREIKMVFEKIAAESGINDKITSGPKLTTRQTRRIASKTIAASSPDETSDDPLLESISIDVGLQHLPIPNAKALEFLSSLWLAIKDGWSHYKKRPIELRRCLFLALALQAMPLRRLWRLRYYISGNAIVRSDSETPAYFFVAPIPQKDQGMGLIPLRLSDEAGSVIWEMTQALASISIKRSPESVASQGSQVGFDSSLLLPSFTKQEFLKAIMLAVRLTSSRNHKQDRKMVLEHLETGTKFLHRIRFGAQIFNSLSGKAIVPANYFAIEDLLFQAFGSATQLLSITGKEWRNVFVVSESQKKRVSKRRQGEAQLILDDESNNEEAILSFAAKHFAFPTAKKIEKWLIEKQLVLSRYRRDSVWGRRRYSLGRAYQLSARRISHKIMMSGDLPVGSPEHLLFPSQTTRFFEIFDQTLRRRYDGDYKHEIDWWVTIVALLGCRPFEALQIKYEHLDFHFDPRIIRILGTKNESAQRTVDINLFATDPVGRYLKNRLLKMGKGCFPLANYKSPTDDKKFERCIESANRLIGYAYGRLRAEIGLAPCSGVFTMTSFRHACAFRLHQTAVTDTLWGGNLWSRIASNSIAMGHKSMVTTWSSYIGTSALAIIWPSRGKNGKNYCPIRDNPHDIFDPKTESRTGKSC